MYPAASVLSLTSGSVDRRRPQYPLVHEMPPLKRRTHRYYDREWITSLYKVLNSNLSFTKYHTAMNNAFKLSRWISLVDIAIFRRRQIREQAAHARRSCKQPCVPCIDIYSKGGLKLKEEGNFIRLPPVPSSKADREFVRQSNNKSSSP